MNSFYYSALQKLGFRQQAYQTAFAEGSPGHLVLADLADYSRAFNADTDGISHDVLMAMHGRRQMFFRIIHHLKLAPHEIEAVYRTALMRAAARLQTSQGVEE